MIGRVWLIWCAWVWLLGVGAVLGLRLLRLGLL